MNLQLTAVIATLKSNDVGEGAHCARVVFPVFVNEAGTVRLTSWSPEIGRIIPGGRSNTRDPVLGGNLALVNGYLGQVAGVFIPFKRMSGYGRDVDIPAKITREIAKVSALLNDRTSTTDGCRTQVFASIRPTHLLDLSHQSGLAIAS